MRLGFDGNYLDGLEENDSAETFVSALIIIFSLGGECESAHQTSDPCS